MLDIVGEGKIIIKGEILTTQHLFTIRRQTVGKEPTTYTSVRIPFQILEYEIENLSKYALKLKVITTEQCSVHIDDRELQSSVSENKGDKIAHKQFIHTITITGMRKNVEYNIRPTVTNIDGVVVKGKPLNFIGI